MRSADVVIIGCGVIGASVAYHLAKKGCSNVLVLERAPEPGQGSTNKATGGFRAQFGSEINVRLSLLSRQKLRVFHDELGVDPGYRTCGYLFIANSEQQLESLKRAQLVQKAAGLMEAKTLDCERIAEINPAASLEGAVGGTFCPTDGFIVAMQILSGYQQAAKRLGVRFEFDVSVTGFGMSGNSRIETVKGCSGEVAAGCVVNAAGAWACEIADLAGFRLPVTPLRRQVAITEPTGILSAGMPMTVFVDDGFHFRVREGRVMLLWPDDAPSKNHPEPGISDEWLKEVQEKTRKWVPSLKNVLVDRNCCWSGLYEMSPDKHVLLGAASEVRNLYLVNGSSGHGVMHAPALGQLLAETICDGRASSLDVHCLRPSRFEEGEPISSPQLL